MATFATPYLTNMNALASGQIARGNQQVALNDLAIAQGQQDAADRDYVRTLGPQLAARSPDALGAVTARNPEMGAKIARGWADLDAAQAQGYERDLTARRQLAQSMIGLPDDQAAKVYREGVTRGQAAGVFRGLDPAQVPSQAEAQALANSGMSAQQLYEMHQRDAGYAGISRALGGAAPASSGPTPISGVGGDLSGVVHGLESGGRMTPGITGDGGAAFGPMQVHAGALTDYNRANGTNLTPQQLADDPAAGKAVGDWYLGQMRQRFGRDDYALGAYNAGPGAMQAAIASGKGIAGLPAGAQQYVAEGMRRLGPSPAAAPVQVASAGNVATDAPQPGPPQQSAPAASSRQLDANGLYPEQAQALRNAVANRTMTPAQLNQAMLQLQHQNRQDLRTAQRDAATDQRAADTASRQDARDTYRAQQDQQRLDRADQRAAEAAAKPTQAQLQAAGYLDRLDAAHKVITDLGSYGTSRLEAFRAYGGTATSSPERQRLDQAERSFVNAILRQESGAAISEGEFESARRQYFPQAGEGPEVVEQKRQERERAINNFRRQAGPAYSAPQGAQAPAGGPRTDTVANPLGGGQQQAAGLSVGAVHDGYRYRGGNPNDRASWEPVN